MTAPFLSLIRFFSLSVYAPAKRGATAKKDEGKVDAGKIAKDAAKKTGIAVLAIVLVADVAGVYGYMSWMSYDALKPVGMQSFMLLNAVITAAMLVFVMSFITALSTYCASKADTNMLALPIPGRDLLGAKMAMVYLADFALAFLLVAVAATIYAIREAPPASFYFGALAAALAVPLAPIALIYLAVVPLVSAARPLRNKNAVMIIGGVIGIALSFGLNYLLQTAMAKMQSAAWVLANVAGPDSPVARAGRAYLPAFLAWRSMTSGGIAGPLYGLANLGFGFAAVALVAVALGGLYAKSLLGFDEQRIKRVKATTSYIARSFREKPALAALFLREWRLMNREPVYFMNGPFVILIMPLVLAVGVLVVRQRPEAMADVGPLMAQWKDAPWLMLAAAAFGAFTGSSTSITCTALSRDAKALRYLKALPMGYRDFMLAKFLHGFAFAIFGAFVGGAGLALVMGLPALDAVAAFLIALAFSALSAIAGLWLDTANPRLGWDTPTAALKQNINATVFILAIMGAIAGLGVVSAFLPWDKLAFFALYFGVFTAGAAALLAAYPNYARRKLDSLEV
jgi:hypothetical protein